MTRPFLNFIKQFSGGWNSHSIEQTFSRQDYHFEFGVDGAPTLFEVVTHFVHHFIVLQVKCHRLGFCNTQFLP